nr:MAG TPA: hypothetical protein [Caudoviricetes sp.]
MLLSSELSAIRNCCYWLLLWKCIRLMDFQRRISTQKRKKMTAETVLIVFRELSEAEKERFLKLLEQEMTPKRRTRKKRKPKVWDDVEIVEKLEVLFNKEVLLIAIISIIIK